MSSIKDRIIGKLQGEYVGIENRTDITDDGRTAFASVPSTMGGKIIASAVFLDLGITDAITDKHREYPASYVVPIKAKSN